METGRIVTELLPNEKNNRNSEGSFIRLSNGDLLFVYSRYSDQGLRDNAPSDLYGILSHNDGESFGEPFPVLQHGDLGADNLMSVSFLRMQNGDIGLFFCMKHNTPDGKSNLCIPYLVRSSDEGKSWSKPTRCVSENGYFVLNNDRVLLLPSGRILLPTARLTERSFYAICIYASDDDGISWTCLARDISLPVTVRGYPYASTAEEPGLAVLGDGTVWCYIRTVLGRQYETFSSDDGNTWTVPQPSQFTSPPSPMSVRKLKNGNLFVVWNPIPLRTAQKNEVNGVWICGRTPYAFTILGENGVPFLPANRFLAELPIDVREFETDEGRGYCYPAIFELDKGDILLAYCAGEKFGHCLSTTRIRKIKKEELPVV